MRYSFLEAKNFYASRRGFDSFANMTPQLKNSATIQINQIYDYLWYFKQWGFTGDTFRITFVPSITNTVSGTAGERVITFGTAVNESYSGVKVIGNYVLIAQRLYKLIRRRSSTVWTIDSPLLSDISGATVAIYFIEYPLPYNIGAIRSVKRGLDDIAYIPEYLTEINNQEGIPDYAYNAGQLEEDFLNSGTLTVADGSNQMIYTDTVSVNHIGMSLLLKESTKFQFYRVIDVDTTGGAGTNKFIVDRAYQGSATSAVSFILNPKGLQKIGFKDFPTTRELVEIKYTIAPNKLIDDDDMTQLPDDSPLMAGIEVVAEKWEAVGSNNMNAVVFQDKKFKEALRVLNWRATPLQNKIYTIQEVNRIRRYPRQSNPWNLFGG